MVRWLILVVAAGQCGCGSLVTKAMVYAPNAGQTISPELTPLWLVRAGGADRELRVAVGPPEAVLRVWIIEPRLPVSVRRARQNNGLSMGGGTLSPPPGEREGGEKPKGTLLVMHGYHGSIAWVKRTGRVFAESGYRVVLIDQRGHGRSSGDYLTYGVVESRDASRVLDALEREGLVEGPVGVWGVSMGAATAILMAAGDERVKAVVAAAPYTSMREVAPGVVGLLLPPYALVVGDETIRRYVDAAGAMAGFDPEEADVLAAIKKVKVPTLILHGDADWVVPDSHGRRLHEANPVQTRLVSLPWVGHLRAHYSGAMRRESVRWFDEKLGQNHEGHKGHEGHEGE